MKTTSLAVAFLVASVLAVPTGWAQKSDDKEHAELAKALKDAKISLQRGLTASAKEGKPISAKYEVEDGKLQLSVYTMKGNKFSEVIVDHKAGTVAKRSRSPVATISRRRRPRARRWPRRSGHSRLPRPRP